eukprot:466392-Amphidinium_carterae.1
MATSEDPSSSFWQRRDKHQQYSIVGCVKIAVAESEHWTALMQLVQERGRCVLISAEFQAKREVDSREARLEAAKAVISNSSGGDKGKHKETLVMELQQHQQQRQWQQQQQKQATTATVA